MKEEFNHQVVGVPPEQSRAAFVPPKPEKSMVEQEEILPVLKPSGIGEDSIDRLHFRQRLNQERQRVQQYQMQISEIHTRIHIDGKLIESKIDRQVTPMNNILGISHPFNQQSTLKQPTQEHEVSL